MLLLIPTLLGFLLLFPAAAWAYIDPGFGGYVYNFVFDAIIAGAVLCAAVFIYLFRSHIWQKYQKFLRIFFFVLLGLGGVYAALCFYRTAHNPPQASGARVIDPQRMSQGYNFYDGQLIDEKGRVVKQWRNYFLGTIDHNGDYYGGQVYEKNWGRYTWEGTPVWEKDFLIHHELYLSPAGTIFTFTTENHNYNNFKVDFDVILEFDKDGKELQRYSFWEHRKEFQEYKPKFIIDIDLISTPFRVLTKFLSKSSYDYFHINSFTVVPPNALEGRGPAFRPGNWLISLFHGSMVFILDQDTKKILWHAVGNEVEGGLQGQHAASMLPDGSILLFENGFERKASRVLIIDPLTLKVKWQYRDHGFYSEQGGFVQVLPNGNFLITESDKNHAFELTPDKKIVWEYYGSLSDDHTLYRMTRYPKEMIDRLLQ